MKHIYLYTIVFLTAFSCRPDGGGVEDGAKKDTQTDSIEKPEAQEVQLDPDHPEGAYLYKSDATALPVKSLHIFLDGSGSTDAYLSGASAFENALGKVHITLKDRFREAKPVMHIVTQKDSVLNDEATRQLLNDPSPKHLRVVPRNSSNMADMLNLVLAKAGKDGVAIWFSDCVMSVAGSDTEDLLNRQRNFVTDALNKHKHPDFQVSIFKMQSDFEGTYYTKSNAKVKMKGQRPFYIWIMGHGKRVKQVTEALALSRLQGYQAEYHLLTLSQKKPSVFASLLSVGGSSAKGRFKPCKKTGFQKQCLHYEDVEANGRDAGEYKLVLPLALDLSKQPFPKSYLMDPKSYTASSGWKVLEVKPLAKTDLTGLDAQILNDANGMRVSHLLLLGTAGTARGAKGRPIEVSLNYTTPAWIAATNSLDDSKQVGAEQQRTFGFKQLVEGVAESLASNDQYPYIFTATFFIEE